jgi:hypothetical protein
MPPDYVQRARERLARLSPEARADVDAQVRTWQAQEANPRLIQDAAHLLSWIRRNTNALSRLDLYGRVLTLVRREVHVGVRDALVRQTAKIFGCAKRAVERDLLALDEVALLNSIWKL